MQHQLPSDYITQMQKNAGRAGGALPGQFPAPSCSRAADSFPESFSGGGGGRCHQRPSAIRPDTRSLVQPRLLL